jgi:hypothetical protein
MHPQALVHYSAINDGTDGGRVAAARLHTLLALLGCALLGCAPPRAASDGDEEEELDGGVTMAAAKRAANRTCVIVVTTALDDATLARLGLLPKYVIVCIDCIMWQCGSFLH